MSSYCLPLILSHRHMCFTVMIGRVLTNVVEVLEQYVRVLFTLFKGSPNVCESTIMQASVSHEFDDSCISFDSSTVWLPESVDTRWWKFVTMIVNLLTVIGEHCHMISKLQWVSVGCTMLFTRVTILTHDNAIDFDEVLALHTKSTCCCSKSITNMVKSVDDRCKGSPNEGEITIEVCKCLARLWW